MYKSYLIVVLAAMFSACGANQDKEALQEEDREAKEKLQGIWLDDNTEADDFTTDEDTPKYMSLDAWREMQQRQVEFEFVGPPKHNPEPYVTRQAAPFDPMPRLSEPVFDDLRI